MTSQWWLGEIVHQLKCWVNRNVFNMLYENFNNRRIKIRFLCCGTASFEESSSIFSSSKLISLNLKMTRNFLQNLRRWCLPFMFFQLIFFLSKKILSGKFAQIFIHSPDSENNFGSFFFAVLQHPLKDDPYIHGFHIHYSLILFRKNLEKASSAQNFFHQHSFGKQRNGRKRQNLEFKSRCSVIIFL